MGPNLESPIACMGVAGDYRSLTFGGRAVGDLSRLQTNEGVVLLYEIDLSFGMRRCSTLITNNKCAMPKFRRKLGRYVLPVPVPSMVEEFSSLARVDLPHYTHEIPRGSKGKQPLFGKSSIPDPPPPAQQ